ncbi:MAG: hypothetical protein ACR2OJ_04150 [Hyphomicrobiales bacterium]
MIEKVIAALIALACIAGLVALNKQTLFPNSQLTSSAGSNPEYIKCRDQRLGDVEKMKKDGIIDEAKVAQFTSRALAMCGAQFPPGN